MNRKEFNEIIRKEFIPFMNKNGLNFFIKTHQREMFTEWTMFFFNNKIFYLTEYDKNENFSGT